MKIEIINPINGKGLNKKHIASDIIEDDSNYIEIGAVVRDDNNETVKDVVVSVETSDETQNKTMTGTGNVYPIRTDNKRIITPYYPFHYEFREKGKHTITFKIVNTNIKESVKITVEEKKQK